MAKKDAYRLGSPKTDNPVKEMLWCFSKNIRVIIEPEYFKNAKGDYEMTMMYQVVAEQGNKRQSSGYIYNRDNVVDAVNDAYRKIYQKNAKKEE